jgi:DNA helicase II / ATP-dependent DNA helicase PcrA
LNPADPARINLEHRRKRFLVNEHTAPRPAQVFLKEARNWSPLQKAIFEEMRTGSSNILVVAVPGSGKTTSIVEAMNHIPGGRTVLAVAFNKSIASEMSQRVPRGVVVSTLHSHGLKSCSRAFNRQGARVEVNADKAKAIVKSLTGEAMAGWARARERELAASGASKFQAQEQVDKELREWANSVTKCVSLSKSALASTADEIEDTIDAHDLCPPEKEEDRPRFVAQVLEALRLCAKNTMQADFDDMIWFPHVHSLNVEQFDEVFVDEGQDLTPGQTSLVLKSVRMGGRITVVGDPHQSIYQFAGAASNSMEKIQEAIGAKTLPLSVTYRCSKAVVEIARTISKEIAPAPDAIEGSVTSCNPDRMLLEAKDGDFILSRTNAPLVGACLAFLKAGKRAHIQGRDIGTNLGAVISRAKTDDVDAMLGHVDAYTAKEVERLTKRDRDSTSLTDTQACIHVLAEGETSVQAMLAKIERLFADTRDEARITLATTHKAKGLERDRVWLLRDTFMKRRPGKEDAEIGVAEENLFYVAVTRARKDLFLVREPVGALAQRGNV